MGSKRNRDVAWGFFYTDDDNRRTLRAGATQDDVRWALTVGFYFDASPIFRITPPKPKRKAKK